MHWLCRRVALWALMVTTSGTSGQKTAGHPLTLEDSLLLDNEPSPKCLTRMQDGTVKDFTCFFKTTDNSSYDFYYTTDNPPRRTKCEMWFQTAEDKSFLHFCTFPQLDIFWYVEILLEVIHRSRNDSLYMRTVTVEDNILPELPKHISMKQNENIGELEVSWQVKCGFNLYNKIRFSSKSMKEKIKQGQNKRSETLAGLMPGEEVKLQVSVRCSPNRSTGHWSHWSAEVRAVVPQSADDISLKCYTKDLENITCQWDGSKYNMDSDYKLFYKREFSQGWTNCTECSPDTNGTGGQCGFHGDVQDKIRVKLSSPLAPLSRTFYGENFQLNNIIKTPAPSHLKQNGTDPFCVVWESPLPALSSHLQYEASYKLSSVKHWMTMSPVGPETAVCLKVSWSSQVKVKVRAKPQSAVYSGHWSEWSDVLTVEAPAQSYLILLIQCSPILLLVFAVIFILLFYKYFNKLKHYIWPPLPNLDKVLQEYLSDMKLHKLDSAVITKQLYAEASIVDVLSTDCDSELEENPQLSTGLLCTSDTSHSNVGQEDRSTETGAGLFPDYVALSRDTVIHICSKQNSYIYRDDLNEEIQEVEDPQSPEHDAIPREDVLGLSNFLNHSYLLLDAHSLNRKERVQRGHGNLYTNMPCN